LLVEHAKCNARAGEIEAQAFSRVSAAQTEEGEMLRKAQLG
jgi:hypothetical protein